MSTRSIWAIGDIHGMLDPLRVLLDGIKDIEFRRDSAVTLVFLGDYIDHGPSSREVVDFLLELQAEGDFETVFLAGNHEDLLLQFLHGSEIFEDFGNSWFNGNGGADTVCSFVRSREIFEKLHNAATYDMDAFSPKEFPLAPKYRAFFESLRYAHTETLTRGVRQQALAFTHSSLYANLPNRRGAEEEPPPDIITEKQLQLTTYEDFHAFRKTTGIRLDNLHIWNREIPAKKFGDYLLVHGHTPTVMLDEVCADLGSYDIASRLPYLVFARDNIPARRDPDALFFKTPISDIIALNIDTGLVYGNALSAVNFSEQALLDENWLGLLQVHAESIYRGRNSRTCLSFCFTPEPRL